MRSVRLALITVVLAVVPLAACGDANPSATHPDVVRIGYQVVPNGDLVVKDQRLLEKALGPDVKVEWNLFASGGDVNQAIVGGSLDLGLVGSSPASRGISTGIDYQIPWIFDVIGSAEALVARKPIDSIEGLRGKTIATPLASTAHFSLLAALRDAGLQPRDVTIIDAEPAAIVAAWKAGKIDAAYVWNPSLAEVLRDGGRTLVTSAHLAKEGKTTYDLGVVSTRFAKQYPEAVQAWVDQQAAAVDQIRANDPRAFASVARQVNISEAEARRQMAGLVFIDASTQAGQRYLGRGLGRNLFETARFNHELGQIQTVAAAKAYQRAITSSFAAAVK